ncbi:MAG: DNA alkylation repair protein [Phycisphaerales bacterium]|nr:DNA alkylation repair protein [Phycisphaerales bacterium]
MPKIKSTPKKATKTVVKKPSKAPAERMNLKDAMSALEKAGSAQTRKTYARHGVTGPMFGVSFATLKALYKRIKVDQELAEALWSSGNFDARNLAVKIADPAGISPRELDRWAATPTARMCGGYVGYLTAESPHGRAKADKWLAASDETTRSAAWCLVGALAMIDETIADSWFVDRLAEIENGIRSAPNAHRYHMNGALIAIGGRNAALRKAATAAAKRIGAVDVDHGDTDCKTPDAVEYIEKNWARAKSGGFDSPAAHERSRESMRTRC